jgi:hypothetical protein
MKGGRATMIRDQEGFYWLQTVEAGGRFQSSFLGDAGPEGYVRGWCIAHEIEFVQVPPAVVHHSQVCAGN